MGAVAPSTPEARPQGQPAALLQTLLVVQALTLLPQAVTVLQAFRARFPVGSKAPPKVPHRSLHPLMEIASPPDLNRLERRPLHQGMTAHPLVLPLVLIPGRVRPGQPLRPLALVRP